MHFMSIGVRRETVVSNGPVPASSASLYDLSEATRLASASAETYVLPQGATKWTPDWGATARKRRSPEERVELGIEVSHRPPCLAGAAELTVR